MIQRIAVLLTCYNRKEQTITCLKNLYIAHGPYGNTIQLSIYMTDDASTDGTKAAVSSLYPAVQILNGTGDLFWAGGMRNSWKEAIKNNYDAYLLLNDDTRVSDNLFSELMRCDEYSLEKFNTGGIYVGPTHDGEKNITYGGSLIISRIFNKYRRLVPNGSIQPCDLGNANIMLVTKAVFETIGILSNEYWHGGADYDYTFTARKKNIPVLIAANYCGICFNNPPDRYAKFAALSFSERRKFLYHPKGLALADYIKFMKKLSPWRVPFIYVIAWLKLLFPNFYIAHNK